MFFMKKHRFSPGTYRVNPETYEQDYRVFHRQNVSILRELRTVKIIMAVLIPLFVGMSVFSTRLAVTGGLVCAGTLSPIFLHKKSLKPVAAVPLSVAIGIVFGFWIKYQVGV
jgi:hypothetical protein